MGRFWPKSRYNGRVMAREIFFYQCLWVTKFCAKFGCSRTPRTISVHNSSIVLRCMRKEPAPFNSDPASQNVSMFRKIDRKKSKPCVVHGKLIKRIHLFKCRIHPFFARFKEFPRSPLEAGWLPTGSMTPLVMTAGLSNTKMVSMKTTKMVSINFIIFCLLKIVCL